jgi:hypothetical protein
MISELFTVYLLLTPQSSWRGPLTVCDTCVVACVVRRVCVVCLLHTWLHIPRYLFLPWYLCTSIFFFLGVVWSQREGLVPGREASWKEMFFRIKVSASNATQRPRRPLKIKQN